MVEEWLRRWQGGEDLLGLRAEMVYWLPLGRDHAEGLYCPL